MCHSRVLIDRSYQRRNGEERRLGVALPFYTETTSHVILLGALSAILRRDTITVHTYVRDSGWPEKSLAVTVPSRWFVGAKNPDDVARQSVGSIYKFFGQNHHDKGVFLVFVAKLLRHQLPHSAPLPYKCCKRLGENPPRS